MLAPSSPCYFCFIQFFVFPMRLPECSYFLFLGPFCWNRFILFISALQVHLITFHSVLFVSFASILKLSLLVWFRIDSSFFYLPFASLRLNLFFLQSFLQSVVCFRWTCFNCDRNLPLFSSINAVACFLFHFLLQFFQLFCYYCFKRCIRLNFNVCSWFCLWQFYRFFVY